MTPSKINLFRQSLNHQDSPATCRFNDQIRRPPHSKTGIGIANVIWLILFCVTPAMLSADDSIKLKDLQSIRAIAPTEAPGMMVDFEATVTYVDGMREFLFVQDGKEAIFVHRPEVDDVNPGQRVRVQGRLAKGDLLPIVANPIVTVLRDGSLPSAEKVTNIGLEHDCRYLEFEFDILQSSMGLTDTLLYAKTESGVDVCIQILHPDGVPVRHVPRIPGNHIKCTGVLGLQISGGAFIEPGIDANKIEGYKIFCTSPEAVKIKFNKASRQPFPAQVVGLSSLKENNLSDGRFFTFAQVCMIDDIEPKGIVVSDGPTFMRFNLESIQNLQPGMLLRIGGTKSTDQFGKPKLDITYLCHLTLAPISEPELTSVKRAVETFSPDKRIAVQGTPLRVEDRDDGPYLIIGNDNSTIAVKFQNNAKDVLSALDPTKASKVQVTGVSKSDDQCDFQLVVARPGDAVMIESKASISRYVVIGLGILSILFGLAALWIKLLKSKVAQKQRFESIFDNAGCPIIVFNGDLRIIDANQLAADMTGFSKDELRRLSVTHIDKNLPRQKIVKMLSLAMDSQEVAVFRTKILDKDKRSQDVEVHCRNLTKSNDPAKATYIAIFPDITERNKYENELKNARDEAIQANEAKSRFLAAMSHELRTPLNGVIGMTQLLENTDLTSTQADYLASCRTSGETLLTVIGDVLDFSKMEAGKLELESRETELIPFIENILRATSLQQKAQHIDLGSFVDPRLSQAVMIDSNRFRQVMYNLIGNATKFTSQGSITVTAKCSEVTSKHADVQFVVADTGIGIPKDRIACLFEAFEQCDSSTTREYGGTGLGLAICKQIVDSMDGRMFVESVEGVGSKFIVELRLPFATSNIDHKFSPSVGGLSKQPRVAVMGMSKPISKLLHETFSAYKIEASFFGKYDVLPGGKFDVIFLNNDGDSDAINETIAAQTPLLFDDAPILIPVIPANCVLQQKDVEGLTMQNPLHKPFSQTHILQSLKLGQANDEQPKTNDSPLMKAQDRILRILLCEDAPVNQMFVKEVCRSAGIKCVVCDNGKEAIETLQRDAQFDVIFMDCQMPVMDGFEATRLIREMSKNDLIPKIPIVALTANAVLGDEEKCLEAGMDDYLAKPFEIQQFIDKIHTNAALPLEKRMDTHNDTHDEKKPKALIFDSEKLLEQINDEVFVMEIAQQFAESFPSYQMDFKTGLQQQDVEEVFSVAHRLKGSAGTVKAERISNLATEMELAAREGQMDQLELQIVEMLKEFEDFANVVSNENPAQQDNYAT